MKSLVNDFGYYFSKYGITPKQLKENYENNQSIGDFAGEIFQKNLSKIASDFNTDVITLLDFYDKTADTYQKMAYLLKLENKDGRKIQPLYFENKVKYMELFFLDLKGVRILSYGCCEGCHPYHNKILTISESLEFAQATETRCQPKYEKYSRCTLVPEIKEDENSPFKITVTLGD